MTHGPYVSHLQSMENYSRPSSSSYTSPILSVAYPGTHMAPYEQQSQTHQIQTTTHSKSTTLLMSLSNQHPPPLPIHFPQFGEFLRPRGPNPRGCGPRIALPDCVNVQSLFAIGDGELMGISDDSGFKEMQFVYLYLSKVHDIPHPSTGSLLSSSNHIFLSSTAYHHHATPLNYVACMRSIPLKF